MMTDDNCKGNCSGDRNDGLTKMTVMMIRMMTGGDWTDDRNNCNDDCNDCNDDCNNCNDDWNDD